MNSTSAYDFGLKFRIRESDESWINPRTGFAVWAEPLLVLYFSISPHASTQSILTLRFGLTRSRFECGLRPSSKDCKQLLEVAAPHVDAAIADLEAGRVPRKTHDILIL